MPAEAMPMGRTMARMARPERRMGRERRSGWMGAPPPM
jgi:hypothetical protein